MGDTMEKGGFAVKAVHSFVLSRTHLECAMQGGHTCKKCKLRLLLLRVTFVFGVADSRVCTECGSNVTFVQAVLGKFDNGRVFDPDGHKVGYEVNHTSC